MAINLCEINKEYDFPLCLRFEAGNLTQPLPHDVADINTYKYIDRGAQGAVYKKNDDSTVLKIILSYDGETAKDFKERCMEEINKQMLAAENGLAPELISDFIEANQRVFPKTNFVCFIEMPFLQNHIWPQDYPGQICDFILELAKIKMVNKTDPMRHFYMLDDGTIQMIDYGFVEYKEDINEDDIFTMVDLCGVNKNIMAEILEQRGGKTRKSKKMRKLKKTRKSKKMRKSKKTRKSKK
jgi:hypothetical protein